MINNSTALIYRGHQAKTQAGLKTEKNMQTFSPKFAGFLWLVKNEESMFTCSFSQGVIHEYSSSPLYGCSIYSYVTELLFLL